MLVVGRIATAYVTANAAEAQVHPTISRLEALFAALCPGLDVANLTQMIACEGHIPFL
jgi:hypothetical protein